MEDGRYACSCRQDDSIIPDNLPEGYNGFVVKLLFRNEVERTSGGDALGLDSFTIWLKFPKVEDLGTRLVSCLCCTRVNLLQGIKDLVLEKVDSLVDSMLKDTKNADKKVLPIAVEVAVRTLQGSMDSEQEAIARGFIESNAYLQEFLPSIREEDYQEEDYQEALEHVSAVRSKAKALEYVTVSDLYLGKQCMLCSFEFSAGVFVARMPVCSHVYHGDCIIDELMVGNFDCPRCTSSVARPRVKSQF